MQEDVLMMRIAEGDEDSFTELYGLWCKRVMAYAFRSLRDLHEAQDVVQETFIQVYRAAPSYRAEGKFGAFVFRIAGNIVRGRFRHGKQVDSLTEIIEDEALPHPESLSYSPEESVLYSIDIERMLSLLPPRQKEALILIAGGVTYGEGAEMLQISVDAFAQLVLRGRRALKMKMARMGEK
ncbi:MAG: RNA polymerase sigma factor [Synergistaceae bacterium]|jgi:RNA polymerase sigma-70 factor (ECF subfamily)|nr:RNA polymerase sigma factor [Synergistaceae bacterium]